MNTENINKFADNLQSLFGIMSNDSKYDFVQLLERTVTEGKTIGEKIHSATDKQLFELLKRTFNYKFTESPKEYIQNITQIIKDSTNN